MNYDMIILLVAYLLGSLSFAVIVTKITGNGDIRAYGSGNAGASNVARTVGLMPAVCVVAGDVLKGTLAAYIGYRLNPVDGALLATVAAIIGHRYPIFFGLKGGKCIATMFGCFLIVDYRMSFLFLAVWLLTILLTRYIGLASIFGIWVYPLAAGYLHPDSNPLKYMCIALGWVITFFHRDNIKRIRNKTEPKLDFKLHHKEGRY